MNVLRLAAALFCVLAGTAAAQDAPSVRRVSPGDTTDQAVARAIDYLISQQGVDGSIATDRRSNVVGMTSLSVLAMAAVGHQPSDDTREGIAMRKALAFVLRPEHQDPTGYFGKDGSRMYGHGITTLLLTEMAGMGVDAQQDQILKDRVRKAVELILKAQSVQKNEKYAGGWRYQPDAPDSDLSVTVWQLMALRSAKNGGFDVPKESIDFAVDYVKRSYSVKETNPAVKVGAGCTYQIGRNVAYAMSAAGLLSLQVCGTYDGPEVEGSAKALKALKLAYSEEWFFYGTYYYAQGLYQRGGEYAQEGRKNVEEILLPKQLPDGSWLGDQKKEQQAGKVYCTSMAILSLAVKYHYLPIYQR